MSFSNIGRLVVTCSSKVETAKLLTYLDSGENGVSLADKADYDRTLLDGLRCILDLEDATLGRESDRIVVIVVPEHGGGGRCGV